MALIYFLEYADACVVAGSQLQKNVGGRFYTGKDDALCETNRKIILDDGEAKAIYW